MSERDGWSCAGCIINAGAPPATCSQSASRWWASARESVSELSTGSSMAAGVGRTARGVAMTIGRTGAIAIAGLSQVGAAASIAAIWCPTRRPCS